MKISRIVKSKMCGDHEAKDLFEAYCWWIQTYPDAQKQIENIPNKKLRAALIDLILIIAHPPQE